MHEALLVVFLLVAIGLVALVMLQQGKGADMGASFGAGASATLFGSSGSGNFMTRMTAIFATLFFIISLVLGNLTSNQTGTSSKWENISEPAKAEKSMEIPAVPAAPNSDIPQ
ncbi:preprotein translocase subunit SecG [Photorhabdus luminescens subsp. luminescens]|uniref:Protein-export membrane protein SecG n=2 Tax=Photorhabdus luminescens TaxID=29488 RepID=A0A1G5QR66_PHOLU|nr:preprotein translocase subunit SecG [Photorhabdus luminescens]KMW71501.1 preprotein translocase subunit SecG [Photorhabdus luminescens subsp. luminescens]MCW7761843.1 preprotein translocase subunit SecG [Photorhabdus luminescens subsp. venezuelensis]OWO80879.1 preprotein translocase subunit SecG [Photorhabdus luminescens]TDB49155.1 preprotein translocase subunit SecG [Photorhabdus luminescens subsp. mexicana]SCZ64078.1 protein translocase subunit secG [Photorhabdus luminescens]